MTVIEWDKIGERIYQAGVDRGVLYLKDGTAVPWNGLVSVEDTSNSELKSFYLDGIKILDHFTPGDFAGKLKAFTYPDEFDRVNGIARAELGLSFYNQPAKSFHLAYRTKVGNDVNGIDYGYKLHLLYNLIANPDSTTFDSFKEQLSPIEFAWTLSGVPPVISGHRPTAHISVDSNDMPSSLLQAIEDILYGTSTTAPRFPSISEITTLISEWDNLTIVDNGDGTWTAIDPHGYYISMTDSTTFQIDHANVSYLDANTYQISDTDTPLP